MKQNPASWIDPITEACEDGDASCFTTGIDPGFANDMPTGWVTALDLPLVPGVGPIR